MLIGNLRNIIQRMMKYYFSNMTFSNYKEIKIINNNMGKASTQ